MFLLLIKSGVTINSHCIAKTHLKTWSDGAPVNNRVKAM